MSALRSRPQPKKPGPAIAAPGFSFSGYERQLAAVECLAVSAKKPTEKPKRVAKPKPEKPKRVRKPKTEAGPDPYSEILGMLDQLLDSAEDDLSREAMEPVAAVRAKCATLTVALRMCLLALSCHGQEKDFARQIAENLDTIVRLKTVWNEQESQEDNGREIVAGLAAEEARESNDNGDNEEADEEAGEDYGIDEADEEAAEDDRDEYARANYDEDDIG